MSQYCEDGFYLSKFSSMHSINKFGISAKFGLMTVINTNRSSALAPDACVQKTDINLITALARLHIMTSRLIID